MPYVEAALELLLKDPLGWTEHFPEDPDRWLVLTYPQNGWRICVLRDGGVAVNWQRIRWWHATSIREAIRLRALRLAQDALARQADRELRLLMGGNGE